MLIRCPTCASGYELESELLPDGRILRCAYCRDAWVHKAPHRPAVATLDLTPTGPEIVTEARFTRRSALSPTPARRRPAPQSAPDKGRSHSLAASLLALAMLSSGMAVVAGKARLVAAFPPSEALFATLGLPVNLKGLDIVDVSSTIAMGDAPRTLTLEGRIANVRSDPTSVPVLRIAVRDKTGRELYSWTAPAPKAQLAAGETVPFHSRLSAPPADGLDVAVSFAEPSAGVRRLAEVMPGDR